MNIPTQSSRAHWPAARASAWCIPATWNCLGARGEGLVLLDALWLTLLCAPLDTLWHTLMYTPFHTLMRTLRHIALDAL